MKGSHTALGVSISHSIMNHAPSLRIYLFIDLTMVLLRTLTAFFLTFLAAILAVGAAATPTSLSNGHNVDLRARDCVAPPPKTIAECRDTCHDCKRKISLTWRAFSRYLHFFLAFRRYVACRYHVRACKGISCAEENATECHRLTGAPTYDTLSGAIESVTSESITNMVVKLKDGTSESDAFAALQRCSRKSFN